MTTNHLIIPEGHVAFCVLIPADQDDAAFRALERAGIDVAASITHPDPDVVFWVGEDELNPYDLPLRGTPVAAPMPTTVKDLWNTAWTAENEDEAFAQAERMFDLFVGRRVAVDRLTFDVGETMDEVLFSEPWPEIWVDSLSVEQGWDGDVLYAEWYVHAADPDQVVVSSGGIAYRMGDIEDDLMTTTAPGIGTEKGFGNREALIRPVTHGQGHG